MYQKLLIRYTHNCTKCLVLATAGTPVNPILCNDGQGHNFVPIAQGKQPSTSYY